MGLIHHATCSLNNLPPFPVSLPLRYLLLELKFSGEEDRRAAYANLTERSLVKIIKDAILALHGDYGLACVLHSINGWYVCPPISHSSLWYKSVLQ